MFRGANLFAGQACRIACRLSDSGVKQWRGIPVPARVRTNGQSETRIFSTQPELQAAPGTKRPHVNVGNVSARLSSDCRSKSMEAEPQGEESRCRMGGAPALMRRELNSSGRRSISSGTTGLFSYWRKTAVSCLQIKITRSEVRVGNLSRKGCFSNLSWSVNRHSRPSLENVFVIGMTLALAAAGTILILKLASFSATAIG
jgi:hypothetical protein